jgi:chemotaxis protein MotB
MIQRLIVPAAIGLLLCACGNSKKLQSANAQITQLQANNTALTKNVDDLKKEVTSVRADNASIGEQLNTCQKNAQATAQKLRSTEAIMREEQDKLQQVQKKIDNALADFENKGVQVYLRNGLVYVSMSDKLLYKSGSAAVTDSGKSALSHLAGVLNDYPKLEVIVEGNTDSVQFKKGSDNWTLSTERANGVVRLLRDANVDPVRITSSGKGKYNPVADNATAEGRARNRRTDIILNPDMNRIWASVDK